MSFLENIAITKNLQDAKVSSDKAIDIYNKKDSLEFSNEFYFGNPELYDEEIKRIESNRLVADSEKYKGLGLSLAQTDLTPIASKYPDLIKAQEDAILQELKQSEYEDKWWGSRAYQQAKKSYYGMQISKLESKLHDFELGETALSENEISDIKNEIYEYYKKISEIPEEKSGYVTTGASIVASGVEFAPQLALGTLATALTGGTAGAAITAGLIYNKSKDVMYLEVKNMVDEANPDLDSQTKSEYIDTLTSGMAIIESIGSTLGFGGIATKTFGNLIKQFGLKKTTDLIKNKSFKYVVLRLIGEQILAAPGEATEEALQATLIEKVRPIVERGEDLTTIEALRESYVGLSETAQRLAQGSGTDFDKQILKQSIEILVLSPFITGAIQGSGAALQKLGQYKSNRTKSQANLKKTQDYKKARDNNQLKAISPEADKAILKNIIEANAIDGHVYFADSVIQNLIEESPNSEVYADAVNRMNLVEALNNSVDGTVKIDLQTANEVIFDGDGALYQELENHIMWSPDSMSPAMFEIYTDALASEVTETDQKFIDDIAAKLEPTSTPDQARANALSAFYIADALSRADPRMTREQYGQELADKISVGDIEGVNEMITKEVEKPQTVVQKAVRKAKKVVGKVKEKIVSEEKVEPQVGEQLKYKTNIERSNQLISNNIQSQLNEINKITDDYGFVGDGSDEAVAIDKILESVNWRDLIYSVLSKYDITNNELREWLYDDKNIETIISEIEDAKGSIIAGKNPFTDVIDLSEVDLRDYKDDVRSVIEKYRDEGEEYLNVIPKNIEGIEKSILNGLKDTYEKNTDEQILDSFYQEKPENYTLFQDIDKQRVGEIDINTLAIKLSSARNPTTVLHEFEHYFDLKLDAAYRDGVLQDYWLKRYRDLKKYQGAKYNPKTKEYYFESKEAERKGREKSANALTQYILEGQAPVKELQSLFQVMKDWFKMVYETIKNFPRVKLNKSITRVFDSIFAKELEVETLMRAERLGTVEKPDNVTDAQWRDYLTAKESARGASTSASIKAATELANKRSEQAYAQKKAEFYTQELADLQSDLHYQARDLVGAQKINRASIEGLTDGIKLNPKFLTKEGGLPAQFVVDNYGFNSVTEMIDFINNTNDTQTIAEQIATEKADAWAIEQYPELINIKAENAVRNIALIKTQVYESMMLKGIPLDRFNLNYDEMILSTEKIIQGMQMKEITNLDRWQSRMRNLNEKIIVAQRKGDKKTLGDLRYRSAILNYIMLRAKAIVNNKKKFDRKFERFKSRPNPNQLKRIEGNVWDMIHSVLFNFGFTQRQPVVTSSVAERLTAYINDIQSKNFTNLEGLKNQAYFLTNPEGINVANMKVEDFNTIDGSLRILENVSKRNLSYTQDEKIREYDEDVNEVVDHYEKNKISKWNENDTVKNIFLGHIGMKETLLSRLFPERLFIKYVLPFMNGLVQANKFIREKSKEIIEILKPVMKYAKREYTIDGRVFTYEQLAVIMANMGNEHNMKCMANTLGVTETELFSIADQSPVELRDVAQKLWDMFEENSQQFKEVVERMRGTPLKMVEAKPITFSDGQTLRGGYYPANKKANTEAKDYLEEKSLKTDRTFPAFYFEKERSDAVHKDLDTTFKTLETWVYKMAMTINVAEAYNNLSKITHSKRIENVMGEGAKKELTKWMGQATMPESVNKFVAMFDSLSSVEILGWKLVKVFIQMSGIIPAMKEVGVVPIVKEFLKTATNPYNIAAAPWRAAKLSDYMNERYSHPEEHIADVRKMSWLDGGKTQKGLEWASWFGMLVVNYGDAIAGQVTWRATYEKSIAEGKTESEAVSLADSMVRRTQGDTSAGSRPPVLQGNLRFLNKFSSYFIGINSILSADWTSGRKRHAIAMLAVAGILAPTAEAFISALNEWEDADDEQKRKWRKKGIYNAEDYLKRKIYENSISSSASSLMPAYGIGFRTAQYWNYGKYYAPEITALTKVTNLTTMPIDVYNYLKTGDEKDYEKAFKKSFEITPLGDEQVEWLLEKLSRR